MTTIGLVGAGQMGSAVGRALAGSGLEVVTTLDGRSERTARLIQATGIATLPDLAAVMGTAQIVLVIVPPGAAVAAATQVAEAAARTKAHPLVADLNAISPSTVERVSSILASAGLDLVDGSISGPPPSAPAGTRIYLSGPRAREVAQLRWAPARPIVVGDVVGLASAVKMCTASVYKGVIGILVQALWAASHHGVVEHVLADLAESGYDSTRQVVSAATKAWRFVPEMREISETQRQAGLPGGLFEAMATVYELLAGTRVAQGNPESADRDLPATEVVARLTRPARPATTSG